MWRHIIFNYKFAFDKLVSILFYQNCSRLPQYVTEEDNRERSEERLDHHHRLRENWIEIILRWRDSERPDVVGQTIEGCFSADAVADVYPRRKHKQPDHPRKKAAYSDAVTDEDPWCGGAEPRRRHTRIEIDGLLHFITPGAAFGEVLFAGFVNETVFITGYLEVAMGSCYC